jgi:hypothetical protein
LSINEIKDDRYTPIEKCILDMFSDHESHRRKEIEEKFPDFTEEQIVNVRNSFCNKGIIKQSINPY